MLTLKKMYWDNCFSYGFDNVIDLNKNPLTQLVGTNGAGKTSISLMLQEVLYGKNNKNIKKQDITNNKSGKKGYNISLDFNKDGDDYNITLNRTSSLKLKFSKNGVDISSHTSLNTYKSIAEVIGIDDFKVFCQLIYQHSTDSLDFLTATDTNRKKFLISLLQLDKYIEYHEQFKSKARDLQLDINTDNGAINTIEAWIRNHESMDFIKRDLVVVEEVNPDWYLRKAKYEKNINNINSINRKITTNNQYKKDLAELDSKYYMGSAPARPIPSSIELRGEKRVLENQNNYHIQKRDKLIKMIGEKGNCPQCLQEVNQATIDTMLKSENSEITELDSKISINVLKLQEAIKIENEIKKYKYAKIEFERLSQLIDYKLESKTLDLVEQKAKLSDIIILIANAETRQKTAEKENLKISAHNSKVDVVKSQLEKMNEDLRDKNIELIEKENLSDILELLKKTFGTNGLVSYKIESSVKELEKKINEYLSELTYFQIYFKLAGEKLNIEVLDDSGNITSISNLSSGERARVNIASILAIRSILSTLTSTKINLLMLDEVIGVIDAEGKEKLSEILLKENLNTFIVSHDWSHPLIPKINIIKEHNISRIESD